MDQIEQIYLECVKMKTLRTCASTDIVMFTYENEHWILKLETQRCIYECSCTCAFKEKTIRMTAYKFTSQRQLRELLNDAETVQKKDIRAYAGGHLNENFLYKPPSSWASVKWTAGKDKPPIKMVERSVPPPSVKPDKKDAKMKETLYDFCVGTTGSVPVHSGRKSKASPRLKFTPTGTQGESDRPESTKRHPSAATRLPSSTSRKSVYTELQQDHVLVEELKAEEMMLPSPRVPSVQSKAPPSQDTENDSKLREEIRQSFDKDDFSFQHVFLPTHHIGVTKTDQFNKMKNFESNVIRKQDSNEQNVLTGSKAVQGLESHLKEELEALNFFESGPNFHKLQVYSNTFEDLIEETSTFSYLLRSVKTEYDNYISHLLDAQTSQNSRLLRDQVEQMAARGTSRPNELQDAKDKVQRLEERATQALTTNDKLRKSVTEEAEWLANAPDPEPKAIQVATYHEESATELADEIEHVKALILEKLDDLNALRTKLREEHVPLTVCTHLEQCIKETEVEVQKLLKQNEYLERSIAEMEADLKEAVQDADTSERDARRIWRKVNSRKGLPHMNLENGVGDSDEEDDDESKWNWYIS